MHRDMKALLRFSAGFIVAFAVVFHLVDREGSEPPEQALARRANADTRRSHAATPGGCATHEGRTAARPGTTGRSQSPSRSASEFNRWVCEC